MKKVLFLLICGYSQISMPVNNPSVTINLRESNSCKNVILTLDNTISFNQAMEIQKALGSHITQINFNDTMPGCDGGGTLPRNKNSGSLVL